MPGSAGRPALDLIVTLDDATSELYSAFLVEEEGTFSSLRGLAEVIGRHGLFCSLYTDRGSHYFVTPKAGGKVDAVAADPGRAGARRSSASSTSRPIRPQARGRMERVFGTLQQPPAAGAAPGRDHDAGGGQPLPRRALRGRAQRPLRGRAGRARQRLRAVCRGDLAEVLCVRSSASSATTTACATRAAILQIPPAAPPPPLRQGQGAGARLSRTAGSPSSTARAASPAIQPDGPRGVEADNQAQPPNPARRRARWICGQRSAFPTTPPRQQHAADI